MKPIPVAGPWITKKEIAYVTDAVTNAWYENANVYHDRLEAAFRDYLMVDYAMALPSCTSAIHLALAALGIGPGDEVIVPELTWIASAAPVSYVGATPVFVDIDPKTWCISLDAFERAINKNTKAVIVVDLYGNMPNYRELNYIAKKHGITVIEDAAEAIGSRYKSCPAGSCGDVGVFSFHGSKTVTAGEGGMLVCNDTTLFKRCQVLRDHGRDPKDTAFFNSEVAYKYKMSSMQAALALAQMERLPQLVKRKKQIFEWYHAELWDVTGVSLNPYIPDVDSSDWMVTAVFNTTPVIDRTYLTEYFSRNGIATRPMFYPLSSLPAYRGKRNHRKWKAPHAYSLYSRAINLPSALTLMRRQVVYVCDKLKDFLGVD